MGAGGEEGEPPLGEVYEQGEGKEGEGKGKREDAAFTKVYEHGVGMG